MFRFSFLRRIIVVNKSGCLLSVNTVNKPSAVQISAFLSYVRYLNVKITDDLPTVNESSLFQMRAYNTLVNNCQPFSHLSNFLHKYLRINLMLFKTDICLNRKCDDSDESLNYDYVSEETLESIAEYFEEVLSAHFQESDSDVSLTNGVLTVYLGGGKGTYVINKQSPNKQIWLSSPFSGPKRYDLVDSQWIYRHDGVSLHDILNQELSEVLQTRVDFTSCAYGKPK